MGAAVGGVCGVWGVLVPGVVRIHCVYKMHSSVYSEPNMSDRGPGTPIRVALNGLCHWGGTYMDFHSCRRKGGHKLKRLLIAGTGSRQVTATWNLCYRPQGLTQEILSSGLVKTSGLLSPYIPKVLPDTWKSDVRSDVQDGHQRPVNRTKISPRYFWLWMYNIPVLHNYKTSLSTAL
jgi:hypothetical protein